MNTQLIGKSLGSIETKIRQKALENLKAQLPGIPRENYKFLAYGLFFFYYHSDGLDNQETDAQAICSLFGLLKRVNFVYFARTLLEVFKRLWHRIDYHRVNKYLGLVKDVLRAIYCRIKAENSKKLFTYWNKYLSNKLFMDDKCQLSSEGPAS